MTKDYELTFEQIFNKIKEKYLLALKQEYMFEPQNYTFIIGVECAELITKHMFYIGATKSPVYDFNLYGIKVELDMTNKYRISLIKEIK